MRGAGSDVAWMDLLDGFYLVALSYVAISAQCPEVVLKRFAVLREWQNMINMKFACGIGCRTIPAKHTLEMVSIEDVVT